MTAIYVHGIGAVSPAGWGVAPFRQALQQKQPLPTKDLNRPGWERSLKVRQTLAPMPRPAFLAHARLRRTSPITHFVVGAALEALGADAAAIGAAPERFRLGLVYCAMSGCVNYSRRFYEEVLKDPSTASPLLFPETVYNSPASHLAAFLGTTEINYTLVGDPGTFLQGIALAADWLASDRVDGCLVAGAEELDWLTADALHLFETDSVVADGAGALYLKRDPRAEAIRLHAVTDPRLYAGGENRRTASRRVREELRPHCGPQDTLFDGIQGRCARDSDEQSAWTDWTGAKESVKPVFGEAFMAGAAWQCVAAIDALRQGRCAGAVVSVVGCNEHAIAARFISEPTQ